MSTTPPTAVSPPPPAPPAKKELILISHSNLFYWWPVWFFGFVFALFTLVDKHRLVVVPEGSTIAKDGDKIKITLEGKPDELEAKLGRIWDKEGDTWKPRPRVENSPVFGTLYVIILLVTIFSTNIPLRGLWSVIAIGAVLVIALLITVAKAWDKVYGALGGLQIYANMSLYLLISLPLFVVWLAAYILFDQRKYMIFTPGQVRVCEEIGDREKVYDTGGMTVEKHRDDIFRHIVLGFGSGDLTVRTAGADRHEISMPNILRIDRVLPIIEQMIRERPISTSSNATA